MARRTCKPRLLNIKLVVDQLQATYIIKEALQSMGPSVKTSHRCQDTEQQWILIWFRQGAFWTPYKDLKTEKTP